MTLRLTQASKFTTFQMNFRILALAALSTLIPLSRSGASACSDGSCATGDAVNMKFHGDTTMYGGTTYHYTSSMTMYAVPVEEGQPLDETSKIEVNSSTLAVVGDHLWGATTENNVDITPENIYQGKVSVDTTGEAFCCWTVLLGLFDIDAPCGMVFETRSKRSGNANTSYSDWKESKSISQAFYPYNIHAPDATVDFQVRLHVKDNDSGDSTSGDGGGSSDASVTSPTIPNGQQNAQPLENGQPAQITPAGLSSTIALGSTPESGGFNTGSLSLQGTIAPSLADMTKLKIRDPKGNGLKVYRDVNLIQVRNSKRLADVRPLENGGYEVSMYESDSFTPPETESGESEIISDASKKIRYEPVQMLTGIHLGGIKVTSIGPNGSERVQEVVNLSGDGVRVTAGEGLLVQDFTFGFEHVNGHWQRTNITTEARDGVLFSKTERTYLYQYRMENSEMVENQLFLLEGKVYSSTNTCATTTWEPDTVYLGRAKSVTRPDGAWEAYSYYNGVEGSAYSSWMGLIKKILRPWNGSPSSPATATSSNSESTAVVYDSLGDKVESRITYKPGASVVTKRWEKSDNLASLTNLVDLLEDAGLSTSWSSYDNYTYLRQDSSVEYASATEEIPSTSFTYVKSRAPGCPWVGDSFGSLDAEGNGYVTGYELGTYTNGNFTPNSPTANPQPGSDVRAITIKIANYGAPVASEATREVVIRDFRGRPYLRELSIKNGTGWDVATTTSYAYDYWADGSVRGVTVSQDGRVVSHQYAESGDETVTSDEQGIETSTVKDVLGRTVSETRAGVAAGANSAAQPAIVTHYSYLGRATTKVVSAGGLSRTEVTVADLAGRTISNRDASGAVTGTSYPNGGRDTGTTLPGGLTRLVTRNIDGRTVSVTGTAIVDETYEYALNTSGHLVTTRRVGDLANSPRYTITEQDWAGRIVSSTSPDPSGGNDISTTTAYQSNTRRMISSISPSGTVLFTKPSAASSTTYSGYDVYEDEDLTTASLDRVTETKNDYVHEDGKWWQVSTRKAYDDNTDTASAVTSITKSCLYGLPDGYASKTISISPSGQVTTVTTSIDRGSKTLTRTEMIDGVDDPAVTVVVNGLTVSQTGHDHAAATRWYYNALGQPVKEVSPRGAITRKSYNPANGALQSSTDNAGNTTHYAYYPATHASAGKLSMIVNPKEGTTIYQYSALGQVTEEAGTAAYKVTYEYDAYGARNKMWTWRDAANSSLTEWVYQNGTGLLQSKKDADNKTTAYTYDSSGKIHVRTWARTGTVTTTYEYNDFGDLTGIDYSDGTPDVTFSGHDRLGRPTTIAQAGVGSETLSYHAGTGKLHARNYSDDHPWLPKIGIRYAAPDSAGRPSGFDETADSNDATPTVVRSIAYTYHDDSGLLQTIADGSGSYAYAYHQNSSLISTIHSSAENFLKFRESRHFDTPGRLVGIRSDRMSDNTTVTAKISYHAYVYDSLGRRVKNIFQDGSFWEYGYNDRSEVTSASRKTAASADIPQLGATYSYDGIGNRFASTSAVLGNHTYTPDSLNRYGTITTGSSRTAIGRAPADWTVKITADGDGVDGVTAERINNGEIYYRALTASNTDAPVWQAVNTRRDTVFPGITHHFWYAKDEFEPSYDDDGNLTNDGRWAYVWDAENRLIQMETTAEATNVNVGHPYTKVVFVYDWQGRRLARHVWQGGTATTPTFKSSNRWLYDGWNVIAEFTAESDASTTLARTGTFTWGLDLSGTLQGAGGVGGLLAFTNLNTELTYYPSYDGNGNIVAWTRSDGTAPTSRREYDAFGNTLVSEGTPPCAFGFSTKMQDAETGLYYYGYRLYDTVTGRWVSRDPIGERGGINLYVFVFNNPIAWYDYLGREPKWINFVPRQDTSIPRGRESTQKNLENKSNQQISGLNENLDCCCKLYTIGCDPQGKSDVRARLVEGPGKDTPKAPQDRDYLRNDPEVNGALGARFNNNIPLTFTDASLDNGNADGLAGRDTGILISRHGEAPALDGTVLSHELGHVAGYMGNLIGTGHDSNTNPNGDQSQRSLMAVPHGTKPTRQWCERVVKLAK